jgi:soluble lytic murein transglycosylase-like protein
VVAALFTSSLAFSQIDGDAIRARMEESLRKQSESVARQLQAIQKTQPRAITPIQPVCDPIAPAALDSKIKEEGDMRNVAPEVVRAVISTESAFVPCAVSEKGAVGLMQLMPDTAKAMGVADPMDPGDNLRGGIRYLGQLLERYGGDLSMALGAYNAGPGKVDKYGGVPPIPETQKYVQDILRKLIPTEPAKP